MDDVFRVKVPHTKTNVYEYFPNYVVLKRPPKQILLHYERIQITIGTVLEHDIDFLVFYERVVIPDNIRRIEGLHRLYLF
jgi:hypothetical protein